MILSAERGKILEDMIVLAKNDGFVAGLKTDAKSMKVSAVLQFSNACK